jgi:hypothetical protein
MREMKREDKLRTVPWHGKAKSTKLYSPLRNGITGGADNP